MEKCFEYKEVHTGVFEQTDLFGDVIPGFVQRDALLEQSMDWSHVGSSGFRVEISGGAERDSQDSAAAEINASVMPSDSRQPMRSPRRRMAIGMLTRG